MVMTINTAHQTRGEVEITTECFTDVIVELVAVRCGVHDDNGTIKLVRILGKLFFQEVEIRNGGKIVVFHSVGIQANKLNTICNEGKVEFAVHLLVSLIASTQEIVIANQCYERMFQAQENIARPFKLLFSSSIG